MKTSRLLSAVCVLTLAGCAVGPDYARPKVDTSAQFKENQNWKLAAPANQLPRGEWWKIFGDPDLDRLEQQLNQTNLTIAEAAAQYRQSLALLQEAQSAFMPTVGADATSTHARSVSTTTGASSVGQVYNASISASWEVDLWGKLRRSAEAGNAKAESSAASLEDTRLSAQAQLAIAYFQLYVADRQARSYQDSVKAYQQQLEITHNQFKVGVAGRAEVIQAQNQLETIQVSAQDMERQRAILEHSIAVLIGQSPSSFALNERTQAPRLPMIPPGLPSSLLERRPDIAASERLVAQANAEIGVAKAAYFPTLTLAGSAGYASGSLANWFTLPARVWSVGPELAATLFDGGLRHAESDAAIASYDQSVATYRQTVLTAFQDVEDNLVAQRVLLREAQTEHQAVQDARESAAITLNQYQAGTVAFLAVAQANATQQSNERAEFTILNSQLTAAVGLIKALGGGYSQPPA
jgi:NodT family efflux transporter outer membrane factor (OMF) lipoprotein